MRTSEADRFETPRSLVLRGIVPIDREPIFYFV